MTCGLLAKFINQPTSLTIVLIINRQRSLRLRPLCLSIHIRPPFHALRKLMRPVSHQKMYDRPRARPATWKRAARGQGPAVPGQTSLAVPRHFLFIPQDRYEVVSQQAVTDTLTALWLGPGRSRTEHDEQWSETDSGGDSPA